MSRDDASQAAGGRPGDSGAAPPSADAPNSANSVPAPGAAAASGFTGVLTGIPGLTRGTKKPPRRHGRVRTELLSCCLGEIVDLSASGMRVLRRSARAPKQGSKIKIKLRCLDVKIKLHGVVVWVRTEAPGLHVVGLQFARLTPELNERLRELVAVAGVRRSLGPRDIRGAA